MNETVENISKVIKSITPIDRIEEDHVQNTLEWIESTSSIFRIQKPDVPNRHLVSYFVMFDEKAQKILLVDHKKAQLWLPTGGHVDVDENPKEAARRECFEELEVEAEFWSEDPIFVTVTVTVGLTAGHTDVSLWYVLKGDSNAEYKFDKGEFNSIKWFSLDEIPYKKSDPHMKRFVSKLQKMCR